MWRSFASVFIRVAVALPALGAPATRSATSKPTDVVARYQAVLQSLRDAGEPVEPADLKTWPTLTPEENGVEVLRRVQQWIGTESEAWNALDRRETVVRLPLDGVERQLLTGVSEEQKAALEAAMKLNGQTRFDWGEAPTSPLANRATLKLLTPGRQTTGLLVYRAQLDADAGRHRAAITTLDTLHATSDGFASMGGLVPVLVATGMDAQAADLAMQLSWSLKVGDAADEVPQATVRRVIQALLDRKRTADRLVQMHRTERVVALDEMAHLLNATDAQGRPVVNGIVAMNGLTLLEMYDLLLRGLRATDDATRKKAFAEFDTFEGRFANNSLWAVTHRPAMQVMPVAGAARRVTAKLDRDRQAAATMLAIRLYRLDHGDALPPTLEALVPTYLPERPIDGQNPSELLRYDPARKILWGLGVNAKDDGGAIGDPTLSQRERDQTTDVVFFLDPAEEPEQSRQQ